MAKDQRVIVVASGMSVTSMYAQHVQNNYHATQNMLKPDSPCCLAIQLKTQYMSMLIITGRLWVPRYPTVTEQSKVVSSMGTNGRLNSKVCHSSITCIYSTHQALM